MPFHRFALASLVALALAGPAAADDSGNFVVRLGRDTTAVEHYTRSATRLEITQVGRSPRVLQRHYVFDLTKGEVSHATLEATAPGSTTPVQAIEVKFGADSLRMSVRGADGRVQNLSAPMRPGMLILSGASPWCGYESAIMKLVVSKRDSLRLPIYYLGAPAPEWLLVQRIGRDSVDFFNDRDDRFHARVDPSGRILGVLPISGTGKFSVDRVASLDLNAMSASFAAREKAGEGLGVLSPRDTVRTTNTGGATLWVDYGRPGKRGREIFGTVVPYGAVWRTGANAATQFKTDKALDFGGTVVPPGFYTLWTIPSANGWKLVVNSETGQWGTEHKADKDLYTIDMKVSTLPEVVERFTVSVDSNPQGGVLNLDWDTTRASAAFTVKP